MGGRVHLLLVGARNISKVAWAMFTRGLAIAQLGDKEKGIQEMRPPSACSMESAAGLAKTWFLLGIAEQLGTIGDVDGGLEHVARSRAYAEQRGEAYRAGEPIVLKPICCSAASKDRICDIRPLESRHRGRRRAASANGPRDCPIVERTRL